MSKHIDPIGVRVLFGETDFLEESCNRYTGVGNVRSATICDCPNCSSVLFPAMNFLFPDKILGSIIEWSNSSLRVLFCPFCAFYIEPYWIRHREENIEIVGGYRDGGEILQKIQTPYRCREILLSSLALEDYPSDEKKLSDLLGRLREPGVYHQIGGSPIRGQHDHLECCDCAQKMKFAGILDYDDLNVPLYEEVHAPVALIIGDYASMNIFSCGECSVIGLKWTR